MESRCDFDNINKNLTTDNIPEPRITQKMKIKNVDNFNWVYILIADVFCNRMRPHLNLRPPSGGLFLSTPDQARSRQTSQ
jgi:hypothetical protein